MTEHEFLRDAQFGAPDDPLNAGETYKVLAAFLRSHNWHEIAHVVDLLASRDKNRDAEWAETQVE